jgi:hypothetical protein
LAGHDSTGGLGAIVGRPGDDRKTLASTGVLEAALARASEAELAIKPGDLFLRYLSLFTFQRQHQNPSIRVKFAPGRRLGGG